MPGTLEIGASTAITSGGFSQTGGAQSVVTVERVNILNGLVTADAVVVVSSTGGDGATSSSDAAGTTLLGLRINGVFFGDVTPAPNIRISVPGVGTVILNEQIHGSLTVNAVRVEQQKPAGQKEEVVVGSSHSSVPEHHEEEPPPPPTHACVFLTGGGRLDNPLTRRDWATFGFNASDPAVPNCGPQGRQLQYVDHGPNRINVHGTDITAFGVSPEPLADCTNTTYQWSGPARVNGVPGFTFTAQACDNREPGVGDDAFRLRVSNGYDSLATKDPVLTGGNIQEHIR